MNTRDFTTKGIVIGFTNRVKVANPSNPGPMPNEINDRHVFQVWQISRNSSQGTINRVQLSGKIIPVDFMINGAGKIISATQVSTVNAPGAAFIFNSEEYLEHLLAINAELLVRLQGDFVVDENGKAVDAEFVRAALPTGDRPAVGQPGYQAGVQGGVFESWFWVNEKPQ